MTELLPPLPLLSVFLVASLVLAVTPGPGVFYIVTRSVAEGRAVGMASVIGVALGNLGGAIGASVGLAAIISASSVAFEVVRYLGALYLYLSRLEGIADAQALHGRERSRQWPKRSRCSGRIRCGVSQPEDSLVLCCLSPAVRGTRHGARISAGYSRRAIRLHRSEH